MPMTKTMHTISGAHMSNVALLTQSALELKYYVKIENKPLERANILQINKNQH